MPICIECCYPVAQLYHVLHSRNHKATAPPVPNPSREKSSSDIASPSKPALSVIKVTGTKAKTTHTGGGGDVRLTQCPRCKRFADKYVEHDFVVLFIDLVLVKPQVSQALREREPISMWQLLRVLKLKLLQVYRHLLFNRLSHDDDELDVRSLLTRSCETPIDSLD